MESWGVIYLTRPDPGPPVTMPAGACTGNHRVFKHFSPIPPNHGRSRLDKVIYHTPQPSDISAHKHCQSLLKYFPNRFRYKLPNSRIIKVGHFFSMDEPPGDLPPGPDCDISRPNPHCLQARDNGPDPGIGQNGDGGYPRLQ